MEELTSKQRLVRRWIEAPPRPEEADAARVPLRHRERFLAAARALLEDPLR